MGEDYQLHAVNLYSYYTADITICQAIHEKNRSFSGKNRRNAQFENDYIRHFAEIDFVKINKIKLTVNFFENYKKGGANSGCTA